MNDLTSERARQLSDWERKQVGGWVGKWTSSQVSKAASESWSSNKPCKLNFYADLQKNEPAASDCLQSLQCTHQAASSRCKDAQLCRSLHLKQKGLDHSTKYCLRNTHQCHHINKRNERRTERVGEKGTGRHKTITQRIWLRWLMRIKEEVKRKEGERRRKRLMVLRRTADVTARQRIITQQHQCSYIRLCQCLRKTAHSCFCCHWMGHILPLWRVSFEIVVNGLKAVWRRGSASHLSSTSRMALGQTAYNSRLIG